MLRTGHSTTSGVRSYKPFGEKLKSVTSDVLNGDKKLKLDTDQSQGVENIFSGAAQSDDKVKLLTLSFAGATPLLTSI